MHGAGGADVNDAQKDSQRALKAAKEILDGRHPVDDRSTVLITLDHVIATVLITTMGGDVQKALGMFNEGTIPSVEKRIALFASRQS